MDYYNCSFNFTDNTDTFKIALIKHSEDSNWKFENGNNQPLVSYDESYEEYMVKNIRIEKIPDMKYFGDDDWINSGNPGNNFFAGFNYMGALTSLPIGSFKLDDVTNVGYNFFNQFNRGNNNTTTSRLEGGPLTSLPDDSFNISNIEQVGDSFFQGFNLGGGLESLPNGSFDTSNIKLLGNYDLYDYGWNFFSGFNQVGALISLPDGSFRLNSELKNDYDTPKLAGDISLASNFFLKFNELGALTSLPAGSFNTDDITKVRDSFFEGFNALEGALISLPANSFNISSITSVNNYFFNRFNGSDGGLNTGPGGHLISLPDGSFNVNSTITVGGYNFFAGFNKNGDLEKDSSGIKIFVPNSSNIPASPYGVTFDYSDGSSERVLRNNYSTGYRKD